MLFAGPISALVLLGRWDEALAREAEVNAAGMVAVEHLLVHLIEIDCWRGNVEQARSRLERSAELITHESVDYATGYRLHEAQLLRTEGSLRAAQEALEQVLAARSELGISSLPVKLGFVEALECAFELGDSGKLEQLLETIEALRPGERPPLLEAHALRFRAKLAGDAAAAEKDFRRAADIFRERELIFWLAVTELEQAEWLLGRGQPDDAQPLLVNARETFEQLEAKPWLERVDAARIATPDEILA
jgi:ATP/maltotriose-dependent transcriptional regulator MalT